MQGGAWNLGWDEGPELWSLAHWAKRGGWRALPGLLIGTMFFCI